ncbi:MAG TPA: hypothetical protein VFW16_05635 [Streptosporangiaceae bacterium]|nr:hypothetical protein [Streptosporangiaceae bacterium]
MSLARSASAPAALSTAAATLACCLVLAVTGCASAQTKHAQHPGDQNIRALARAYVAIAEPANHRLDVEVDRYDDERHHDLGAAASALRAQAATERQFDRDLARIGFPPRIAATARALIRVNEVRARLAWREAKATSIRELLSFTSAHKMADAQVEAEVRVIRSQLGLPPPPTS